MPRKMAGIAMITMEASIVAIVMLRVVLERATHLSRSPGGRCPEPSGAAAPGAPPLPCLVAPAPWAPVWSAIFRTMIDPTVDKLFNQNYLTVRRLRSVRHQVRGLLGRCAEVPSGCLARTLVLHPRKRANCRGPGVALPAS